MHTGMVQLATMPAARAFVSFLLSLLPSAQRKRPLIEGVVEEYCLEVSLPAHACSGEGQEFA